MFIIYIRACFHVLILPPLVLNKCVINWKCSVSLICHKSCFIRNIKFLLNFFFLQYYAEILTGFLQNSFSSEKLGLRMLIKTSHAFLLLFWVILYLLVSVSWVSVSFNISCLFAKLRSFWLHCLSFPCKWVFLLTGFLLTGESCPHLYLFIVFWIWPIILCVMSQAHGRGKRQCSIRSLGFKVCFLSFQLSNLRNSC